METLYQLKKSLEESGLFLSFSGPISQDLMVELGEILKKQMETADAETSTILKVFSALVEQSQNIIHHSAETLPEQADSSEKLMFGTIAVGYEKDRYFVLGGNKIKNSQIIALQEQLRQLQKMDRNALKALYHKQRKAELEFPESGAGLGLIELARKASEPFEFDFKKIDEQTSFFSLKTRI